MAAWNPKETNSVKAPSGQSWSWIRGCDREVGDRSVGQAGMRSGRDRKVGSRESSKRVAN
jgi:hypothetical protein